MLISKPQAAPSILLVALTEVTVAAVAWQVIVRRRRWNAVRALAGKWGMHFTGEDRFGMGDQVVPHLDSPGMAKVRARDLIYRWEGSDFFCAFTVSFTRGVLGNKHRRETVAAVRQVGNHFSWMVAGGEGKILEKYEKLRGGLLTEDNPLKVR